MENATRKVNKWSRITVTMKDQTDKEHEE